MTGLLARPKSGKFALYITLGRGAVCSLAYQLLLGMTRMASIGAMSEIGPARRRRAAHDEAYRHVTAPNEIEKYCSKVFLSKVLLAQSHGSKRLGPLGRKRLEP